MVDRLNLSVSRCCFADLVLVLFRYGGFVPLFALASAFIPEYPLVVVSIKLAGGLMSFVV